MAALVAALRAPVWRVCSALGFAGAVALISTCPVAPGRPPKKPWAGTGAEAEDMVALWRCGRAEWRRGSAGKRPATLLREMETAREADRRYWKPILDELRQLQRQDKLLTEGSSVRSN